MLNRIYIVVGLIAIAALAAAFIVPRFIQWGDYRDRMEVLAEGVFGTDVTIRGGIDFALLPEPRLSFTDVVVGPPDAPAATVGGIEARFMLMDFLRDQYNLSALVLKSPSIALALDENGLLVSDLDLSGAGNGVALDQARIENGEISLTDRRAGKTYDLTDINGDVRLGSFSGPFQFQGNVVYGGTPIGIRVNSGVLDENGISRLSAFITETNGSTSLTLDGSLTAGLAPKFDGNMVLRQSPPVATEADQIRGNLVLESKVTASTDRIVLNGYTLLPDENRAGVRLTGAASVQLGARNSFEAVVSGGVFTLPPRDAEEVASQMPYELVRLLGELPAPPLPPIPGEIGVDLAEIGLRGAALRNVRVDATTDGKTWIVSRGGAELPGNTAINLSGTLRNEDGRVGFTGNLEMSTNRLDALSQLWRKADDNTPLFNVPATLSGQVLLAGDALGFNHGLLGLNGKTHALEVRLGFGSEPRLDLVGRFDDLGPGDSAILAAMLPDPGTDAAFGVSFPEGSFSLTSQKIRLLGLDAADLQAEGSWSGAGMTFSRLVSSDWGGLSIDAQGTFGGTLTAPVLSGSGRVSVKDGSAAALPALYEFLGVPQGWRDGINRSTPAALDVSLASGDEPGSQRLTLNGDAGVAKLDMSLDLTRGLAGIASSQAKVVASLEAEDGAGLMGQLGLAETPLFAGDGEAFLSLFAEGDPAAGFNARLSLSQGEELVAYAGEVSVMDGGVVAGTGTVDVDLEDGAGLAAMVGGGGIGLGKFSASAGVEFYGAQSMSITGITGDSDGSAFSGDLSIEQVAQRPSIEGSLAFDSLPAESLAGVLFSNAGLLQGDGVWPVGPLAVTTTQRPTRGTIWATASELVSGDTRLTGASFKVEWDQQNLQLADLKGTIGGGLLSATFGECCAGPLTDRTVTGRMSLESVDLKALAPAATTQGLAGLLTGSVAFEGTGASLEEVAGSLAGEGNLSLTNLAVDRLSPGVYPAVAGLTDVLNIDEDALTILVDQALGRGAFEAPTASGAFTIAGGTVRLANFIIEGTGARLAGGLNLTLPSLGLDGSFVLTPFNYQDESGLIEPDSARIVARITGTLAAPETSIDLTEMVAAIQVRANELEVDRLEALRLENEARQREAAEERNRLVEEQRRKAAEEAAARAAAEEAARQQEIEQQQQQAAPPFEVTPDDAPITGPLDLTLQPNVFQGPPVNQPIR
ncbi:AsmA family protein [Devosia soli]|uniref:AsmA family protein n=1 Tax=Devosia soli TaxID=361041 RepID=UPI000AEA7B43|nr:AsmA family protein [Devosia soli]